MDCTTTSPAARRYLRRFLVNHAALRRIHCLGRVGVCSLPPNWPAGLAAGCSSSTSHHPADRGYGLYLAEETDEFQKNLAVQSMVWGIGATLSVTVTWGFLENFVQLRHMDLFSGLPALLWPLRHCLRAGSGGGTDEKPTESAARRAELVAKPIWLSGWRYRASRVNAIETGKFDPSLPLAFKLARLFESTIRGDLQRRELTPALGFARFSIAVLRIGPILTSCVLCVCLQPC